MTAASKDSDQTSDGRREACDEANNADDDRRERSKQTSKCRAKLVLHREACGCDSVEALCKLTTRNLVELVGVLQALLERLRNGLDDATNDPIKQDSLQRADNRFELIRETASGFCGHPKRKKREVLSQISDSRRGFCGERSNPIEAFDGFAYNRVATDASESASCRRDVTQTFASFANIAKVNGRNLCQNNGNICKPFGVIGKFRKPVCKRANAFCRIAHFFERLQRLGKLAEYGCRATQGQIRQLLYRLGDGFYAFCVGLRVVSLCEFCVEVGQLLDKFIYGRGCSVGSPLDGEFNPRKGDIRHRYPPLFLRVS